MALSAACGSGVTSSARFPLAVRVSGDSSNKEKPTEKDESQKWQTRTLDGNTAPHCEHVFVTDEFCAADASTPVRRELLENNTPLKCQADKLACL